MNRREDWREEGRTNAVRWTGGRTGEKEEDRCYEVDRREEWRKEGRTDAVRWMGGGTGEKDVGASEQLTKAEPQESCGKLMEQEIEG